MADDERILRLGSNITATVIVHHSQNVQTINVKPASVTDIPVEQQGAIHIRVDAINWCGPVPVATKDLVVIEADGVMYRGRYLPNICYTNDRRRLWFILLAVLILAIAGFIGWKMTRK